MEAAKTLSNHYVRIRQEMRVRLQDEKSVIPITVRQLEAITRIAESLAKMSLQPGELNCNQSLAWPQHMSVPHTMRLTQYL